MASRVRMVMCALAEMIQAVAGPPTAARAPAVNVTVRVSARLIAARALSMRVLVMRRIRAVVRRPRAYHRARVVVRLVMIGA